MEDCRQHRRFIKNKPQNPWRENFKKKCLEQFRRSRDTQVNQRRFGLNVICEEEVCRTLKNLYFMFRNKILLLPNTFSRYCNLLKMNGKVSY